VPKIVPASSMLSEADGPGSVRARLIDRIGLRGMTLERITLEPGARGPAIVGETAERFLYVIRGGAGSAGNLPLASETMVWIEPGDRLRRLAGDEGLEMLVAGADASADP
jgi:redox-sensitive bicupin YhaK (pirin superfamily)